MEVVNGLLRGTLELKRGELILRALNTAVRNIRRVRFDLHQDEMIREIPNYPDQPQTGIDDPSEPSAIRRRPTREEIARFREADLAAYFGGPDKVPAAYRSATPSHAAPTNGNATGPQRSATEANEVHANRSQPQATSECETRSEKCESRTRERQLRIPNLDTPSSEGAQECSPRRKPWVSATNKEEQAP
jgi:hypothetical protein